MVTLGWSNEECALGISSRIELPFFAFLNPRVQAVYFIKKEQGDCLALALLCDRNSRVEALLPICLY